MKSLLIAYTYLPRLGGRELYLRHIFSRFSPADLVVLAPYEEGYQAFDRESPVKIIRVERERFLWYLRGRRGQLSWFAFLAHLCWRERIDVVHTSIAVPDGMSGWLLKQVLGKPYIAYTFGQELTPRSADSTQKESLMARVFAQADRVVTISDYTRNQLLSLGVDSAQIYKITPGVDCSRFRPDEIAGLMVRDRYQLGNRPIILTVSRLVPHKGHDVVINALPLVLPYVPDVVYLISGTGPALDRLQSLVHGLGLSNHVIFAGHVSDEELPAFYNATDLFVMPSRQIKMGAWEGFGIVYLEANACGKPVIGGRSGGIGDAVVDGQSGYLVDPESPEAVAEKIISLLQDPDRAKRIGEFGRQWVRQHRSWAQAAEQNLSLTTRILDEHRPQPIRVAHMLSFFGRRI